MRGACCVSSYGSVFAVLLSASLLSSWAIQLSYRFPPPSVAAARHCLAAAASAASCCSLLFSSLCSLNFCQTSHRLKRYLLEVFLRLAWLRPRLARLPLLSLSPQSLPSAAGLLLLVASILVGFGGDLRRNFAVASKQAISDSGPV